MSIEDLSFRAQALLPMTRKTGGGTSTFLDCRVLEVDVFYLPDNTHKRVIPFEVWAADRYGSYGVVCPSDLTTNGSPVSAGYYLATLVVSEREGCNFGYRILDPRYRVAAEATPGTGRKVYDDLGKLFSALFCDDRRAVTEIARWLDAQKTR